MSGPGVLRASSDDPGLRWYRRGDQQLRLARAIDDSEVVYVSYPHWYDATVRSPHAARLEEFVEE